MDVRKDGRIASVLAPAWRLGAAVAWDLNCRMLDGLSQSMSSFPRKGRFPAERQDQFPGSRMMERAACRCTPSELRWRA